MAGYSVPVGADSRTSAPPQMQKPPPMAAVSPNAPSLLSPVRQQATAGHLLTPRRKGAMLDTVLHPSEFPPAVIPPMPRPTLIFGHEVPPSAPSSWPPRTVAPSLKHKDVRTPSFLQACPAHRAHEASVDLDGIVVPVYSGFAVPTVSFLAGMKGVPVQQEGSLDTQDRPPVDPEAAPAFLRAHPDQFFCFMPQLQSPPARQWSGTFMPSCRAPPPAPAGTVHGGGSDQPTAHPSSSILYY